MINKVSERCKLDKHAKFYYASNRMFFELKIIRIVLYLLAVVPVVLAFIPQVTETQSLICSLVSFALTLITEAATSFLNKHKEVAISSLQLYETGVTGSTFSKIEYDRELTNELNELAIRKGLPKLENVEEYNEIYVPKEITDNYSYLYICRVNAATNKYLLSRIFYLYFFLLIGVIALFVGAVFFKKETSQYLILVISFYPLISPILKACNASKECMRKCTKICADIDNYFADGDDSFERLARMYYYVQQIEFEMYSSRPAVYGIFKFLFSHGVTVLQAGVTDRFLSAIVELKQKSLMNKGILSVPKGKSLITQVEYDLAKLKKLEKEKKVIKVTVKPQTKKQEEKSLEKQEIKPEVKTISTVTKSNAKSSTSSTKPVEKKSLKDTSSKKTSTVKPVKLESSGSKTKSTNQKQGSKSNSTKPKSTGSSRKGK
ncbi:MAG: hypothetical protein K2I42_06640 [Anaeroplasmataceae bacterium]|nr:hypothetical protein [Anaeroplasmataceae bacterium]